ncbi:MAG: hypothetical protein U0X20_16990 [Caldilineaceae bacterium]
MPDATNTNDQFELTEAEQAAIPQEEAESEDDRLRRLCKTKILVKLAGDEKIYEYDTPYINTFTAILKRRFPGIEIINERYNKTQS